MPYLLTCTVARQFTWLGKEMMPGTDFNQPDVSLYHLLQLTQVGNVTTTVESDAGEDTIDGGDGNDSLGGDGNDTLAGDTRRHGAFDFPQADDPLLPNKDQKPAAKPGKLGDVDPLDGDHSGHGGHGAHVEPHGHGSETGERTLSSSSSPLLEGKDTGTKHTSSTESPLLEGKDTGTAHHTESPVKSGGKSKG